METTIKILFESIRGMDGMDLLIFMLLALTSYIFVKVVIKIMDIQLGKYDVPCPECVKRGRKDMEERINLIREKLR